MADEACAVSLQASACGWSDSDCAAEGEENIKLSDAGFGIRLSGASVKLERSLQDTRGALAHLDAQGLRLEEIQRALDDNCANKISFRHFGYTGTTSPPHAGTTSMQGGQEHTYECCPSLPFGDATVHEVRLTGEVGTLSEPSPPSSSPTNFTRQELQRMANTLTNELSQLMALASSNERATREVADARIQLEHLCQGGLPQAQAGPESTCKCLEEAKDQPDSDFVSRSELADILQPLRRDLDTTSEAISAATAQTAGADRSLALIRTEIADLSATVRRLQNSSTSSPVTSPTKRIVGTGTGAEEFVTSQRRRARSVGENMPNFGLNKMGAERGFLATQRDLADIRQELQDAAVVAAKRAWEEAWEVHRESVHAKIMRDLAAFRDEAMSTVVSVATATARKVVDEADKQLASQAPSEASRGPPAEAMEQPHREAINGEVRADDDSRCSLNSALGPVPAMSSDIEESLRHIHRPPTSLLRMIEAIDQQRDEERIVYHRLLQRIESICERISAIEARSSGDVFSQDFASVSSPRGSASGSPSGFSRTIRSTTYGMQIEEFLDDSLSCGGSGT